MTATAWPAVVTFMTENEQIAAERIHRVATASGGAVLMPLVDGTEAAQAVFSEASGINGNLIFLLLGIMLIVTVPQPRSRASPTGSESGRPGQHVSSAQDELRYFILGT